MLTDVFESAARIHALRHGPDGMLLCAFADVLVQSGYAPLTVGRHLRAAEHFAHWANRVGMPITGPINLALEQFHRHLRRPAKCPHFGHSFRLQILHGTRLFLGHLQKEGVCQEWSTRPRCPRRR